MFIKLSRILFGVTMALATTAALPLSANPVELTKRADDLREKGESLKAIDIYNQAIVGFQQNNDYANMIGALTGRLLSWKHLFYKTEDKIYAIFVRKEAETIYEITKLHNLSDRRHLVLFLNGTSAILLNDYPVAEREFEEAVKIYPIDSTEKGDWMAHLGDAMYRNGKKAEGKKMILEGVKKIQEKSSQVDSFLTNVWISGAYLRLAKLLKTDNPTESNSYLSQAKKIIDSDDRLVVRKQQLEAFTKDSK